ncbi:MAG: hypothetical protein Q7J55_03410 [bacterium]|nr:hypothetical protein [bacterium]
MKTEDHRQKTTDRRPQTADYPQDPYGPITDYRLPVLRALVPSW